MDYNDTVARTDRLDQPLRDYLITRKGGKDYYKKEFLHLVDVCVWNVFVLYKKMEAQKRIQKNFYSS